jgi:hypothetical protein
VLPGLLLRIGNGKVFEAVAARLSHRATCDVYHCALIVHMPEGQFVVEHAPVRGVEKPGFRRLTPGSVILAGYCGCPSAMRPLYNDGLGGGFR